MAFIFYFIVILVTAAGVMFGLDLATSPLPSTPNVPIGRMARAPQPAPVKPARKIAQAPAKTTQAARVADDRALSPIYPAAPGGRQDKSEAAAGGTAAPKQATNGTWLPPAPPPQAAVASAPPDDKQAAVKTADNTALPAPQPVAVSSAAHCNIAACSAAYRSFRAADCTFQPFEGPRRLCTQSGPVRSAAAVPRRWRAGRTEQNASAPRNPGDRHEVEAITRIVRQMSPGQRGDIAVQDSQGRIVVVHPAGARAYGAYSDAYRD
jgi:BA14K-like protein